MGLAVASPMNHLISSLVSGTALLAAIACSSSSGSGSQAPANPQDAFCAALSDTYTKCAGSGGGGGSCAKTMGDECPKAAAILNPSVLDGATSCLKTAACDTNPLSCLGGAIANITPTDAQTGLEDAYCTSCSSAPADACKKAFFGASGTPGVGAVLLPFGDEPLSAVKDSCTSNKLGKTACTGAFSTCLTTEATKVLVQSISSDAVTCVLGGIKDGMGAASPDGGK
jgi:hypothetical protein